MSKQRVAGTIKMMENGTCIASMRGKYPFVLPPLVALDIEEAVKQEARTVERRLDYQRFKRQKAIANVFEASYAIQEVP